MQIHTPLLRLLLLLIPVHFFHENFRTGLAKPVDTLFDIPHHETIENAVILCGHRLQDELLHLIGILIFINHDFLKFLSECLRRLGWRNQNLTVFRLLPVDENAQRLVLHIRKIDDISFSLGLFHLLKKDKGQTSQLSDCPGSQAHVPDFSLLIPCKITLLQVCDPVFDFLSHFGNDLFFRR